MSNLSDLLPAGAGAKSATFTASGTLSSGQTVILNSDGTVSAVSATGSPEVIGSPTVFKNSRVDYVASAYDAASGKVVIVYVDFNVGSYGAAVVGTVSGTSISFGSAVNFNAASTGQVAATYDSTNQKVVIAYRDSSNASYGTAIVGTVSGTSISFGSATVFESAAINAPSITFDSGNGKVLIAYADSGNSNYGTFIVGTVSGTSISFGTAAVFQSAQLDYVATTYDPSSGRVAVSYPDNNNSFYGVTRIATISGTSITSVLPVVFQSSYIAWPASTYDSTSNQVIIAYTNFGSSSYGTAVVGSISGTTISFGTSVVFEYASSDYFSLSYDTANEKVVISYRDVGNSNYGTLIVGTVSGTSISFGTASVFENAHANNIASVYDSANDKVVISYKDSGSSSWGTTVVFKNESTNSADFVGITDQAIANTATGSVVVEGGVTEKVSGLTTGSTYYIQNDGSLAASGGLPYDISSASYDSVSFDLSSQDTSPAGIAFNSDGTKMFIAGDAGNDINEYTLSSGFDVSTASYSQNFSVASQTSNPKGLAFNTDGTKMFVVGNTNDFVYEYTLSTGFDVSSASYSQNFYVGGQEAEPYGIAFSSDGTKMFIVGFSGVEVNEYDLSSAFDVSTASFSQNFSVSTQDTLPFGIAFNSDGTKMFVVALANDAIYEYTLTTGFDVSTASYSSINFSVASQASSPVSLTFNSDGTKFYIVGTSNNYVYQYSTTAASTNVVAGKALSTTKLLLKG